MAKRDSALLDDEVQAEEAVVESARPTGNRPTLQRPNISSPDHVWRIQFGQHPEHRVAAANDREAWALYCDHVKSWPSPKCQKVFEQVS